MRVHLWESDVCGSLGVKVSKFLWDFRVRKEGKYTRFRSEWEKWEVEEGKNFLPLTGTLVLKS